MADDAQNPEQPKKKLVLAKKTLRQLTIRTGIRTGLPLTDGCDQGSNTQECEEPQGHNGSSNATQSCRW